MKRYKVDYTFYDGTEWSHSHGSFIVEAESAEQAKEQVEAKSGPWGDYEASRVAELGGDER